MHYSRLNTCKKNLIHCKIDYFFPASYQTDPMHFYLFCLSLVMEFIQYFFSFNTGVIGEICCIFCNWQFSNTLSRDKEDNDFHKSEWASTTFGENDGDSLHDKYLVFTN